MAQLKTRGLRKTVGVPGLFATAYGNVGSSIYYALGLVAAHALGLTPVVFMFAGGLFALTAKTYAEGAAMFPEAGGSSSFARHAFNEVVSFIAGWGLSLDYILTIAISAFFVPHYLGAFFPALSHAPGDIIGGVAVIVFLALVNIRGLGESAKLNIGLAVLDLITQMVLILLGAVLVLHPSVLIDQIHLGIGPQPLPAHLRGLDLDARLHRDRDRVQHGGGGARPRRAGAESGQHGPDRGARDLRRDLDRRPLRPARHPERGGPLHDRAGDDLQQRPGAGDRLRPQPARHPGASGAVLRGGAGGDDPADRDQRRDDRHLAPLLVAG